MRTIKLPYKVDSSELIQDIMGQYSSVLRFAYKRYLEGLNEKDIRPLVKNLWNVDKLNSWLVQCAIRDAKGLKTRFKDQKIIFGSRKNFKLRSLGKISKEEFKLARLRPINIQGEKLKKGNRSFDFSTIEEGYITFKPNRNNHLKLYLPKVKNSYKSILKTIQTLSETNDLTVSVRLTQDHIYLSFEVPSEDIPLKETRYLGIDLNPNNIGISIVEKDQVLFTKEYNFKEITSRITQEKNSSDSRRSIYLNNKLKVEAYEVIKDISKLARHYRCKFIFLEDLSKIDTRDSGLGKRFNRLTHNLWKRGLFEENLKKRARMFGAKVYKINPAYSSFIGNLKYEYSDPVNASIEVGRRCYDVIIKKNKKFYPELIKESLKDQWKEHLGDEVKDWKSFYHQMKNSRVKYRVQPGEVPRSFSCFSLKSVKSLVKVYNFY